MNIVQKIADKIGLTPRVVNVTYAESKVMTWKDVFGMAWSGEGDNADATEQDALGNSVFMSCVQQLAGGLSAAPLRVYDVETDEAVPGHPLNAALAKTDNGLPLSKALQGALVKLCMTGTSYIHILRDGLAKVAGFEVFQDATPIIENATITGYRIKDKDGTDKFIPAADVIMLTWIIPNPVNPLYGLAPLKACGKAVKLLNAKDAYMQRIMQNNGLLPLVMAEHTGSLTSEQKSSIADTIKSKGKRGENIVVTGEITLLTTASKPNDLQLSERVKEAELSICGALLVPPELAATAAGMQASTYSNKAEAREFFTEQTLTHFWSSFEDQFTRALMKNEEGYAVYFDTTQLPAFKQNINDNTDAAVALLNAGIVTDINEARDIVGRPPTTGKITPADPADAPTDTPTDAPAPDGGKKKALKALLTSSDGERREQFWNVISEKAANTANDLAAILSAEFGDVEKQVLQNIAGMKRRDITLTKELDTTIDLFDVEAAKITTSEAATDLLVKLIGNMARSAADEIGEDWDAVQSDFDEALSESLNDSLDKISVGYDTMDAELKETISKVAKDNPEADAAKLKKLFTDAAVAKFKTLKESRATTIAVTTTTYATNSAQTTVWSRKGWELTWLSQRDGKVRDSHAAADGTTRGKDGKFKVGSDTMPFPCAGSVAEENVNCRCLTFPQKV